MRILLTIFLALSVTGCLETFGAMRQIESVPSGALVTIDDYGECETPCTVKLDGYRNVTVAKAGYISQKFGLAPTGKTVHVILELAAPTDAVDSETLPDL